jgi:membrane protease YdiL (CAAX protease family)
VDLPARAEGQLGEHRSQAISQLGKATFAAGTVCAMALELNQFFVTTPLRLRLTGKQPHLSDFNSLTGNFKLLLLLLVLAWTLAAFGEEMVYRGYLMNLIADLGGQTRAAWIASLLVVHTLFGLAHSYQGISGAIVEGLSGLLLGLIYLGFRRNLAVPIIAHGITDTVDLVLIFLGKFPGM